MIQKSIIRLSEHSSRSLGYLIRSFYVFTTPILVFSLLLTLFATSGCGGLVSHKVEPGDSLYSIGFYYGHDYRDIAKWNKIPPPYVIHKGQWLRLAPPDEKWWEEEQRRRNAQDTQGVKNVTSNANARGNVNSIADHKHNNEDRTRSQVSRNSGSSEAVKTAAELSKKHVVVSDFTDKAGKISRWSWPIKGRFLDEKNGAKKYSRHNKGIDIAGKRGQLVYAAAAGKIVYSGSGLIGYGKLLIVKHNKTYLSAYGHNDQILVKEGDIVKRGEKIARMGLTPDNQIQLHFEIRRYGKPVNPLRYLSQ